MFERIDENSNNSTALEVISFDTLFDSETLDTNIKTELIELARTGYRNVTTYNTRYSADNVIRRPDISINLNLLKEISTKIIQLNYTGVNIPSAISSETFLTPTEDLQNAASTFISNIFSEILTPSHIMASCNYTEFAGSIAFLNIIKGASFLAKLKKLDIEKANNHRFRYKRLKDLELDLIENKYDNTMVIELTDISSGRTAICVLTNKHSWKKIRKITSKVIDLFPEILINETKEEYKNKIKKLFESIGVNGSDNSLWQETVLDVVKDIERVNQKQTAALEKLLEYSRKEEMNAIQRHINTIKEQINNYHAEIEQAYVSMRAAEGRLLRVEQDPELKAKILEAFEYVNKSKLISSFEIKPDEKCIQGRIDAPIRYFDPAYAKALYKNISDSGSYSKANDRKVFKEIFSKLFIEDKYTLYCSTCFKITLYGNGSNSPMTCRVIQRASTRDLTYIGQPHLDGYSCLGNNKIEAQKACNELDILGLLTVLTTSAQNFNLTDSAVFNHFKEILLSYDCDKKTIKDNETEEWYSFNDLYSKLLNNSLKTEEAQKAKQKYAGANLNDSDLMYIIKALKSIGTLYTTAVPARRIAIYLSNAILVGDAGKSSFYANAVNKTIKLTFENNQLSVKAIDKDYYEFYDKLILEIDDRQALCFTDLLDNYHRTEEMMAGVAGTQNVEEPQPTDPAEIPMPF